MNTKQTEMEKINNEVEEIKKSIDAFFDAALATLSNDQKVYPELEQLEKFEHLEKILTEIRKLPNREDKLSLYYSIGDALENLYEINPELIGKYIDINDISNEISYEVKKIKNKSKEEPKEETKETRNVVTEEKKLNNGETEIENINKSIDAFFDAALATLSNDQKAYPELEQLEKFEHLEKILTEIRKLPNGEDKLSLYYSIGDALEKLYELKPELIGKYIDINDTLNEINLEAKKVKNNLKTEKKDFITKIFKRRTKDSRPLKGKVTKKRKAITNIKKKLVGKFTTIAMVVVLLATNVKGSQKINATSENDILSNVTIEQNYDENEENKQAIQEIVERYEVITKDEETFDVSQQPTNSIVEELNLVEGQTYDFSSVKKGYKSAYSLPEDKVDLKEELAGNLVYVGSKGNKALFAQADEFGNIKKDEQGKIMYMAWYDLTEEEVIEAIQAAQKGKGK